MADTEEHGWILERADSATNEPWYWAAGQIDPSRSSAWTQNHNEAIRFAREIDARNVATRLMRKVPLDVRICEHEWSATREQWRRAEAAEARVAHLTAALGDSVKAENSNARRMRAGIVEARRRLAKGRALWNGPAHECDAVLEQALRADNDVAQSGAAANSHDQ